MQFINMKNRITIKYHTSLTNKLISDWKGLWKKSSQSSIFNSYGWYQAATESFKNIDIIIIGFYNKEQLTGILPLIKIKEYGINFYTTPASHYSQRKGFLIDFENKKLLNKFASELSKLGNIQLSHLNNEEILLLNKKIKNSFIQNANPSPQLPLTINENGDFILSKKNQILKRAKHENQWIKLEQSNEANLHKFLIIAFKIDEKSTKHKNNYNVFRDKELREFYEKLARYCSNQIQINILYYKKTPAAYEIGFRHSDTYIDSERAYLDNHSYYTPGKVIMVKLAEMLATEKYTTLDLGPGIDNFKKSLTKEEKEFNTLIYLANPLTKRLYVLISNLREEAYQILFRYPKLYSIYKSILKHS